MIFKVLKLLLSLLIFLNVACYAQVSLVGAKDMGSLKWWLGLKSGVTFSKVKVMERFSAISAQDATLNNEKEYKGAVANMGQTVGIIFGYAITENFLITFQPAYSNYKYGYNTSYTWQQSNGDSYAIKTKQNKRMGYIELPLTAMFRIQAGNIEPYILGGGYYGFFTGGRDKIEYNESLTESNIFIEYPKTTEVRGVSDFMMKSQMGFLVGGGVSYTIQYFRIGLEVSYKNGLYNITDEKRRYSDNYKLGKFFDVPDNIKLNHIEIALKMFMPVDNLVHLHSGQRSKGGKRK